MDWINNTLDEAYQGQGRSLYSKEPIGDVEVT
jgi:hypothetical protein